MNDQHKEKEGQNHTESSLFASPHHARYRGGSSEGQ